MTSAPTMTSATAMTPATAMAPTSLGGERHSGAHAQRQTDRTKNGRNF